jgi:hypothetical protein
LGSVLFAALVFFTQDISKLSLWAVGVVVAYLVAVTAVTLYVPAIRGYRWIAAAIRDARVARMAQPMLKDMVAQLEHLLSKDSSITVLYVFGEAAQWEEMKSHPQLHDVEHLSVLRSWLSSLKARVNRRYDFDGLCRELGQLIYEYNRFCSLRHQILQDALTTGKLSEQHALTLKKGWNVKREGHARFIDLWMSLARSINGRLGSHLCNDYYEPLGTLE